MSKFISFLFLCFASLATFAQVADLKVSYNYQHYSPDGKGINSQMVLLANNDESKFFNILNERVDSMMVTPEGRMAYGQMVQAAMAKKDVSNLPIKKEPMYVLKSRKNSRDGQYWQDARLHARKLQHQCFFQPQRVAYVLPIADRQLSQHRLERRRQDKR